VSIDPVPVYGDSWIDAAPLGDGRILWLFVADPPELGAVDWP